ncbi:MAG: DUF6702 family protein [bacterium]
MTCPRAVTRLLALGLLLGVAHAHPQRSTLAEAHWRGDRLELAIRVATHDLVAALQTRGEDALGPRADEALGRYVQAALVVDAPAGRAPTRYVGHEAGPEVTWLYAEIPLARLGAATLTDRLLAELGPDVINTLTLYAGPERWTLVFTVAEPTQPLAVSPNGDGPARPAAGP